MPQSLADVIVHLIFSTKDRTPSIDAEMQPRLYEYLGGLLRSEKCSLLGAGGMPDHVHLLVSLGRESSLSELLRVLKANSSRWIHETFPTLNSFAWQAGYAAFSVSHSNLPQVLHYINSQAEHHRTRSFQEELIAFLKRHEVPYDERYIWQ
jgi:putative transposase